MLPETGMEGPTSGLSAMIDPCLYTRTDGLEVMLLYVDDILPPGGDMEGIENTKNMLIME